MCHSEYNTAHVIRIVSIPVSVLPPIKPKMLDLVSASRRAFALTWYHIIHILRMGPCC